MPNYPRPKSSVPKKHPRSSLHPNGAPGFSETVAGLKQGLLNLGSHLVGAGAGIVGNLIGSLTNLKKSGQEGDEEAERAYQEALAMLRGSGSSTADTLLRELGEQQGEDAEGEEEPLQGVQKSESAGDDIELTREQTQSEDGPTEAQPALTPENSTRKDKVICLECGTEFRRLTHTHLSSHGMSPMEYKKKYGLGTGAPVPARSLTRDASGAAKKKKAA